MARHTAENSEWRAIFSDPKVRVGCEWRYVHKKACVSDGDFFFFFEGEGGVVRSFPSA